MDNKGTMTWKDGRGRTVTREVNLSIPDIQKFVGHAGYIWLVIAANPNLSIADIVEWVANNDPKSMRSQTFIAKRRWMFHDKFKPGSRPNRDGQDDRARRIVAEYPELSLRDLGKVLVSRGIKRGKDWIRLNRCTGLSVRFP